MTPDVAPTGHPMVDAAMDELADLQDRPVAEQLDRLTTAHRTLHAVLTDDEAAAPEVRTDRRP